jgi:MFS family permease
MVGLRVLLGVLEAGFFPGCAYLLSCWYPRYDLQKRNAVFYLIGSMASALSGILAYGIMQMDGLANLSGWRWIFIVSSPAHPSFSLLTTCVDRRTNHHNLRYRRLLPNRRLPRNGLLILEIPQPPRNRLRSSPHPTRSQ